MCHEERHIVQQTHICISVSLSIEVSVAILIHRSPFVPRFIVMTFWYDVTFPFIQSVSLIRLSNLVQNIAHIHSLEVWVCVFSLRMIPLNVWQSANKRSSLKTATMKFILIQAESVYATRTHIIRATTIHILIRVIKFETSFHERSVEPNEINPMLTHFTYSQLTPRMK